MYQFRTRTDKEFRSTHNGFFEEVITDFLDDNELALYSNEVHVIHNSSRVTCVVRVWLVMREFYTPIRLYFDREGVMLVFNYEKTIEEMQYATQWDRIKVEV